MLNSQAKTSKKYQNFINFLLKEAAVLKAVSATRWKADASIIGHPSKMPLSPVTS